MAVMRFRIVFSLILTFLVGFVSVVKADKIEPFDFSLRRLQGKESGHLKDHRGKVVIVEFWATYCGHCKRTHPWLARIDKSPQIVSLGISSQRRSRLKKYLRRYKVGFTVLFDPRAKIAKTMNAKVTPTLFVFDQKGRLRFKGIGTPAAKKAISIARDLTRSQ